MTRGRPTAWTTGCRPLGREAARLLFAALDGEPLGSGTRALPAQLIVRASTVSRR